MPKHKDVKRLTRARMEKTGESYTAARAQLLAKKARTQAEPPPAAPTAAAPAAPRPEPKAARAVTKARATTAASKKPDYAALAGMSDEAVKAKTGCTWERWVSALDYRGAASWSHRDIAAYVNEKFGVPGWWSQTVAVGYERIKGLREIGQRRGGSYEAGKSRTFAVPIATLFRAFSDRRTRERWLSGIDLTVRKATPERSMRITWEDGSSVELWFTPKGDAKSQVAVQHTKLASKADAAARKAFWGERLDALAEVVKAAG